MKIHLTKTFKNVSFWILMLQMCFVFSQKKVIVIDTGHGGKDSGAIGINGIQEKDVVLNIAKEIIRLNRTLLNEKFDMYLTRYRDTFISLSDRGRLAKILKSDVFVSIHCNAAKTVAKGMEVYVHNSKSGIMEINLRESAALGHFVLNESTQNLNLAERGVKFANFQVLRETIAYCPGLLVETGFITNTDEADYFLKPKNIRAMALAILMGLYKYLNTEL